MDDSDKLLLIAALSQKDVYPKALASFMLREIIEDAHVKYNITQDDMKSMCTEAVNRAALFLMIKDDPDLYRAFAINALEGADWDESEMTEALYQRVEAIYETLIRLSE